jgi:3',5'-cyclic AMP phosphodiesterase CpdA
MTRVVFLLCGVAAAFAGGADVLQKRCISCHNAKARVGGLSLETRAAAEAVLTGRPRARVEAGQMPPGGGLAAGERAEVLAWLEAGLAASTAPFLLVAGHYPIFSPCAHGNTQWAIDALLPLLRRYNATAYLSGHDHCGAFLAPPAQGAGADDLVFAVTGTGDGQACGQYDGLTATRQ